MSVNEMFLEKIVSLYLTPCVFKQCEAIPGRLKRWYELKKEKCV